MRKGKVGTIFSAVFNSVDTGIALDDEVMLKGWSDGTSGWKVTFWFTEFEAHPFMGFEKDTEFALVLVEMDDDSSAINQAKREKLKDSPKSRQEMKLSNYAAMLCRSPEFIRYLRSHKGVIADWDGEAADKPAIAAEWVRDHLGIKSRSELDTDIGAAHRFHSDIRKPYAQWNSQER
jgi:hypothetical protein